MLRERVFVFRPTAVLTDALSALGEGGGLLGEVVWTQHLGHGTVAHSETVIKGLFLLDFAIRFDQSLVSRLFEGSLLDEQMFDRYWQLEVLPEVDSDVKEVIEGLLENGWAAPLLVELLQQGRAVTTPAERSLTREVVMRLVDAPNIHNPALLALRQLGCELRVLQSDDESELGLWSARLSGAEFVAGDPLALLGLVALWQTRGDSWKRPDDEDLYDALLEQAYPATNPGKKSTHPV